MKALIGPLILLLGACTPQDVGPASGKARFSVFPEALFEAVRASCAGPGQDFRLPSPNTAECRELMSPPVTAAFILDYGGTAEALPRMVIRFSAERNAPGYLVRNDIYIDIPQKAGAPRQVPFVDAELRRRLDAFYLSAGGVPEP